MEQSEACKAVIKYGYHCTESEGVGRGADDFLQLSNQGRFIFSDCSQINSWYSHYGFGNEDIQKCLAHFNLRYFTSHYHVGKHQLPYIYTSAISHSWPGVLLVFAFGQASRIKIWKVLHPERISEFKDGATNSPTHRQSHGIRPFLRVDPASIGDDVEIDVVDMTRGGRIISDPRMCFNIEEGAATLFVYRQVMETSRAIKFPKEMEDTVRGKETEEFKIAAEFV